MFKMNGASRIGFVLLVTLTTAPWTSSQVANENHALTLAADKDSVVRFFFFPAYNNYFHVALLFRVVEENDPRWNTAPVFDVGRTAYISFSEMRGLFAALSAEPLSGIIPKTMHRKRFQHLADTMCQMFCGWRLIESKPNLLKLGSGTLEIDAITGQCVFHGKTTGQLTIAEEIRAWLQQDLVTNKIPIAALTGAHLAVKLSFSVVPWNEPTKEILYSDGKAIRTEKMNRCVMECDSNVTTDESVYRSKLMEVQEWPLGWPNSTAPGPD